MKTLEPSSSFHRNKHNSCLFTICLIVRKIYLGKHKTTFEMHGFLNICMVVLLETMAIVRMENQILTIIEAEEANGNHKNSTEKQAILTI